MTTDPELAEFDVIRVTGKCQLFIQKGEKTEVIIDSKRSGIDAEFMIYDNELLIDAIPDYENCSDSPVPKITITYVKIKSVTLTGSIDLYSNNVITGHTFALRLNGKGDVIIQVDVVNLDCTIVQAGTIKVLGDTTSTCIMILGTGIFQGQCLDSGVVSAHISNHGTAIVSVENELFGSVTNGGTLFYCGTPILRGLSIEENCKMLPMIGRMPNLL